MKNYSKYLIVAFLGGSSLSQTSFAAAALGYGVEEDLSTLPLQKPAQQDCMKWIDEIRSAPKKT